MKNKILSIMRKQFIRNVLIMITGTIGAQAVSILISPIITRIYGPEAFGLMGAFQAVIQVLIPIAALKYPVAIVLPKNYDEARGLARLSFYIIFSITLVATALIFLLHKPIVSLFQLEDIAPFLYLIPVVILFAGFKEVFEKWFIRTKQFYINAHTNFLTSLFNNLGKASVGFFYPFSLILIIFTAIKNGIRVFLMLLFSRKSNYKLKMSSEYSLRYLFKKYKDFPLYRTPQSLTNGISQSIPVLLLTGFFSPAAAGFYSIGRMVLNMPTKLISDSIGDVFYSRVSEASNKGENLTKLIKKVTLSLGVIGLIPFGIIIILGPSLFGLVFGADWTTAGEYARWMSLWLYFTLINRPSAKALPVLSALGFHLVFSIITIIVRTIAFILAYYLFFSDIVAVAFLSVSTAILNAGLIFVTLRISKKFDEKRVRRKIKVVLCYQPLPEFYRIMSR